MENSLDALASETEYGLSPAYFTIGQKIAIRAAAVRLVLAMRAGIAKEVLEKWTSIGQTDIFSEVRRRAE